MPRETKLNLLRREIARAADTEEEVEDIVLELLATNWKEVMLRDKIKCTACKTMILYHEAHFFLTRHSSSKKMPHCNDCYTRLIERECFSSKCQNRFITTLGEDRTFCLSCDTGKEENLSYLGICAVCNGFCPRKFGICYSCMPKRGIDKTWLRREYVKVQTHKENAVWHGASGEFTLAEWIVTLEYFHWLCAYCLVHPYEHLEHFVPLTLGGDTARSNCVPSCEECNAIKGQTHPDAITDIPKADLDRVRTYLAQF